MSPLFRSLSKSNKEGKMARSNSNSFVNKARDMMRSSSETSNSKIENVAMKGAQRENYRFEQPEQELGNTSLIKDHKKGDRFLYAAVVNNEAEDIAGRVRKLIQFHPKNVTKEIPVSSLPVLRLYNETETYNLSSLLPQTKKDGKYDTYIGIDEILIQYGAVISHDADFSKVRIAIIDDRGKRNKTAKAYIANTNVSSKASMSLAYSVPRDEINRLSLAISCESKFLEDGCQWGAAQVKISMTESSFPFVGCNNAVLAVNVIPETVLEDRITHPDRIDVSIMNNDREGLRDMFMEGDLVDESSPVLNKYENISYTKSTIAGPKGKSLNKTLTKDWDYINKPRLSGIAAGLNSVEPSEDGSLAYNRDDSESDKAESIRPKKKDSPIASGSNEYSAPVYKKVRMVSVPEEEDLRL